MKKVHLFLLFIVSEIFSMELGACHNRAIFNTIKQNKYEEAQELIKMYGIDRDYEDGDIKALVFFKETKVIDVHAIYTTGYNCMYQFIEQIKREAYKGMCPVCSVASENLFLTLLAKGVNPYRDTKFTKSPLYSIFKAACVLCMALLHQYKYDFERPIDAHGNRPLHLITQQCSKSGISFLLNHVKVNPNINNNAGRIAIHYVLYFAQLLHDKTEILEILNIFAAIPNALCPIPSYDDCSINFHDKLIHNLLFNINMPNNLSLKEQKKYQEIQKVAQTIAGVAIKEEPKKQCVMM